MGGLLQTVLVCAIVWLYADPARGLVVQWMTSADASYGVILAVVACALIWTRRRAAAPSRDGVWSSAAGLALLGLGLTLHLAGLFAADLFTTRASFVFVAGGLTWFLAGRAAARTMAAPLMFLLLAIPIPELVVNAVTLPLQLMASHVAESTLALSGVPVFREGNVLELPSVTLQVAEACSGLRSAVSLASVALLLAWSSGGPIARRALLVVSTVPIAVVVNGLRIAATGVACETWGPSAAHGTWHTVTGWLTFVVGLLALLVLQWLLLERGGRRAWNPQVAPV
jgi:exosortase